MEYYQILGVNRDASLDEIKRKRNELSYKYHPDSLAKGSPGPEGQDEEMIKKINEAYKVLSDPEKRKLYDSGVDPNQNPNDIFNGFNAFGVFNNIFGSRPQGPPPIIIELKVSINDMYDGKIFNISVSRNVKCDKCANGFKDGIERKCKECSGATFKTVKNQIAPGFIQVSKEICRECSGTGRSLSEKNLLCNDCSGTIIKKQDKIFKLNICDALINDPSIIQFKQDGNTDPKTGLTGDVIFVILPNPGEEDYQRKGIDLYRTVKITLREAFGGLNKDILLEKEAF